MFRADGAANCFFVLKQPLPFFVDWFCSKPVRPFGGLAWGQKKKAFRPIRPKAVFCVQATAPFFRQSVLFKAGAPF